MRRRQYTVLSGSIFAIWSLIEHHVRAHDSMAAIRIIRLKTMDGNKIVGVLLPENSVNDIVVELQKDSESFKEEIFLQN